MVSRKEQRRVTEAPSVFGGEYQADALPDKESGGEMTEPLDLDAIERRHNDPIGKAGLNAADAAWLIAELRATRAERDEAIRQHQQTLECSRKLLDERDSCHHARLSLRGPCPKCGATFDKDGKQEERVLPQRPST
jgi:hypothetical protein